MHKSLFTKRLLVSSSSRNSFGDGMTAENSQGGQCASDTKLNSRGDHIAGPNFELVNKVSTQSAHS